jgi:hypothetical protein
MTIVENAAIAPKSEFLKRKQVLLEAMGNECSEVDMFLGAMEQFVASDSPWCSSCPLCYGRR